MLLVCQSAKTLYQVYFFGIIGVETGTIEVVEPFCEVEVVVGIGIFFVAVPDSVPWFVGLVFACDEAPIVTAYLFEIEQGKHCFDGISSATIEPFGVDDRSAELLQKLELLNVIFVIAVIVI